MLTEMPVLRKTVNFMHTDEFAVFFVFHFQEFQSDEGITTCDKWVLHFQTQHECERFKTALAECWYKHFQVSIV